MAHFLNLSRYNVDVVKEVNNGVSLTIPDQSFSVREILERFRRGSIDASELTVPTHDLPEGLSEAIFNNQSNLGDSSGDFTELKTEYEKDFDKDAL